MVHPQKRLDMKRALEACMGRLLEVRAWMVSAGAAAARGCVMLQHARQVHGQLQHGRSHAAAHEQQESLQVAQQVDCWRTSRHACLAAGLAALRAGHGSLGAPCVPEAPCTYMYAAHTLIQCALGGRCSTACCCAVQTKLNKGIDTVHLDDILVDLKLTPDVLEVPVPRYFLEARAKVGAGGWDWPGACWMVNHVPRTMLQQAPACSLAAAGLLVGAATSRSCPLSLWDASCEIVCSGAATSMQHV
jgi:hypothetical protein